MMKRMFYLLYLVARARVAAIHPPAFSRRHSSIASATSYRVYHSTTTIVRTNYQVDHS